MNNKAFAGAMKSTWKRHLPGYLFAAPWLIGFFGLMLLPIVASFLLSFLAWDGISLEQMEWAGIDNYRRAFTSDEDFWISLRNTAYYSFISVPLGLSISLGLALLLNQELKGIAFFRALFFMPHVVGGIATVMMWMWIFNPDFGLLNSSLRGIATFFGWENFQPPGWLTDPAWSKPALILMSLWGVGGAMLIFLAALQNVPIQLLEASRIDGAGRLQAFLHVTVPQISPAIFFNLIMGIIGSFQVFDTAYILSDGTGRPQRSLLFYVLHLYNKAFQDFEMGYGSALAWILFVIILGFTLIVFRSSKAWVYYEGDRT